jgi:hypothetical protein
MRVFVNRDRAGRLNFLSGEARLHEIADMTVTDIERNMTISVRLTRTR